MDYSAIYAGQRILLEAEYRLLGVPTDPQVVTCALQAPDGGTTQVSYPAESLTRRDVGLYEAALIVNAPGTWHCRWTGAGTVDAVNEISFEVAASSVAT